MPTTANAINESTTGITGFTGTAFVGSPTTQYNVLTGSTTSSTIANVAPSATSGVPLISQGALSQPAFGTAVVAGGGTGATTFTAYAPVIAGTTSTGAFQSASTGLSTSGYVLTSNGASAVPSFQAASGGATNSAFLATSAGALNVTGDGTLYTVVFGTEIFDIGNNFDGTSTFTAPTTGRYQLSAAITSSYTGANFLGQVVASNRTFEWGINNGAFTVSTSVIIDMDAADTCVIKWVVTGMAKTVDVLSTSTYFGGFRIL